MQNINYKASNFLWAIFAAMLLTDLVMLAWCWTLPKGRRTFHYLSVFILTTAAIVSTPCLTVLVSQPESTLTPSLSLAVLLFDGL